MHDETRVDVQRLRDLAASIGVLLDDHSKQFDELYGYTPNLGDFETARWLSDLVTDRRDVVLAHVAYLRRTLTEVHVALQRIATETGDVDAANAAAVGRVGAPEDR